MHDMRGEDDGPSGIMQVADQAVDEASVDWIQSAERLIKNNEFGIMNDAGNELHLLLLSLGQFLAALFTGVRQLHAFQPGVDASVQASSWQTLEGCHELEKLHHAHASIESALFRQVADAILGSDGVRAQHLHRALIGMDDRHDHPDGGALASAVWTNEPGEGSIGDIKVDAANGLGLAKAFPNGAQIDGRGGH